MGKQQSKTMGMSQWRATITHPIFLFFEVVTLVKKKNLPTTTSPITTSWMAFPLVSWNFSMKMLDLLCDNIDRAVKRWIFIEVQRKSRHDGPPSQYSPAWPTLNLHSTHLFIHSKKKQCQFSEINLNWYNKNTPKMNSLKIRLKRQMYIVWKEVTWDQSKFIYINIWWSLKRQGN